MIRRFEKIFTRRFSIITAQYWYEGERFGLKNLLNDATYFNPLFLYDKRNGISVFYDMNNPSTAIKPVLAFFKNKDNLFDEISKKYLEDVFKAQKIVNNLRFDELEFFYKLIVDKIWPVIVISVLLGRETNTKGLESIAIKSFELRQKTDKFEYEISEKVPQIVAEKYPKQKEYAEFLTVDEVLTGKIPQKKELEQRAESFIFFEGQLMINKSATELEKEFNIKIVLPVKPSKKINQFNGYSASLGKVVGKVRILMSSKEIESMQKGEILVAPMTTPDYLPALIKAVAFVTDEGGITSHAAIVAREFNKPCIVGTQIATQVLKDGDFVEVDANTGIVKLLI